MNHKVIACGWALALMLVLCGTGATADTVTLAGSNIPIKGCEIKAVSAGTLVYVDARGLRQSRPVEEVAAIGFEGLPALDDAEQRAARDDYAGAIVRLLEALVAAQTDVQRTWLHVRLARCHDLAGEYVQASGHAARVFLADEHAWWATLAPVCAPKDASHAAAREAMDGLQEAARRVRNAELVSAIDRMLKVVGPALERAAKAAPPHTRTPPVAAGTGASSAREPTWSGLTQGEIAALVAALDEQAGEAATAPASTPVPGSAAASAAREPKSEPSLQPHSNPSLTAKPAANAAASYGPETIDGLLGSGKFTQAAAACERALREEDGRDMGQLLHQLGRALAGMGDAEGAAVRWTQAAVLHPDSPWASQGLIDTAVVYRDHYRNGATARRLLERALATALAHEHTAQIDVARGLLQRMGD